MLRRIILIRSKSEILLRILGRLVFPINLKVYLKVTSKEVKNGGINFPFSHHGEMVLQADFEKKLLPALIKSDNRI